MIPLVGLFGPAGSGKGTVAGILREEYDAAVVSIVDPAKRFCQRIFGWSNETLWGASELRDVSKTDDGADYRVEFLKQRDAFLAEMHIQREHADNARIGLDKWFEGCLDLADDGLLAPRTALDRLGIDWGRRIVPKMWINYGLYMAKKLLQGGYSYSHERGLWPINDAEAGPAMVVFDNGRFRNEAFGILERGGAVWTITGRGRKLAENPQRESERIAIPKTFVTASIRNFGDYDFLRREIDGALRDSFGRAELPSPATVLRRGAL